MRQLPQGFPHANIFDILYTGLGSSTSIFLPPSKLTSVIGERKSIIKRRRDIMEERDRDKLVNERVRE
jgi:hypothetical protein